MKWSDLTKDQQELLLELDREHPMPEGATHFDVDDKTESSWLRCVNDRTGFYFFWKEKWLGHDPTLDERELYVEIPAKPWSDVTLPANEEEPVQKSNIGKWFRVNVPDSVYDGHVGECVEEDIAQGTVCLKFPHKGKEWWSLYNVERADQASSEGCVIKKPNHYQLLPEYEVKDINKALLDKIEVSDFKMTHYEAGFFQQSMQYFMRFYAKNGLEDLKKGVETMQFVIDNMEERK